MRSSIAAQSWLSVPPAPAWISIKLSLPSASPDSMDSSRICSARLESDSTEFSASRTMAATLGYNRLIWSTGTLANRWRWRIALAGAGTARHALFVRRRRIALAWRSARLEGFHDGARRAWRDGRAALPINRHFLDTRRDT